MSGYALYYKALDQALRSLLVQIGTRKAAGTKPFAKSSPSNQSTCALSHMCIVRDKRIPLLTHDVNDTYYIITYHYSFEGKEHLDTYVLLFILYPRCAFRTRRSACNLRMIQSGEEVCGPAVSEVVHFIYVSAGSRFNGQMKSLPLWFQAKL